MHLLDNVGTQEPCLTRRYARKTRRARRGPLGIGCPAALVTGTVLFNKVTAFLVDWLAGCFGAPPLNRASDRLDLAIKRAMLRSPPWSSLRS